MMWRVHLNIRKAQGRFPCTSVSYRSRLVGVVDDDTSVFLVVRISKGQR